MLRQIGKGLNLRPHQTDVPLLALGQHLDQVGSSVGDAAAPIDRPKTSGTDQIDEPIQTQRQFADISFQHPPCLITGKTTLVDEELREGTRILLDGGILEFLKKLHQPVRVDQSCFGKFFDKPFSAVPITYCHERAP